MTDTVLKAISGNAIDAALEAAEQLRQQRQQQRKALELELEQARCEARLAARRYENIDPENRLVALFPAIMRYLRQTAAVPGEQWESSDYLIEYRYVS